MFPQHKVQKNNKFKQYKKGQVFSIRATKQSDTIAPFHTRETGN